MSDDENIEDFDIVFYDDDEDYESDDESDDEYDEVKKTDVKPEDEEDDEDKDQDSNIDNIIFDAEEIKREKQKTSFSSKVLKMSVNEETKLISDLATEISKSNIFIPDGYRELLDLKEGDSIDIAMQWVKHRKTVKIPASITRGIVGSTREFVDPAKLITSRECDFWGLDF